MPRTLKHGESVAAKLRSKYRLLSPFNDKTPKGESEGYLQAILYLAPHTLGGGKSLCPHSTQACRAGCLYTAGRGQMDRVDAARKHRTAWFLGDRDAFLDELVGELVSMQSVADQHRMRLAIRLNGTSDILWERELLDGKSLFELFPRARFFDYTRTPAPHRKVPGNWNLTFSLADDELSAAVEHLQAGRSVAAVVPDDDIANAPEWFSLGERTIYVVHGDEHDLRFLDPPGSLVLLKPKGVLRRTVNPMVRPGLIPALIQTQRKVA